MKTSYFDNLAGVRGLAALVVLASHLVQIYFLRFIGLDTPLHRCSSLASEYAVVVFFILSGYLIAHTLESNIARNGRLRLEVFLMARFARLYPPLLFAILISLAVFFVLDNFNLPGRQGPLGLPGDLYAARDVLNLRASEVGSALMMLQGMVDINGPLWSLYMEAKLYVLYACSLALVTGQRKLLLVLVAVVVAWSGLRYNPGFAAYSAVWLTGCLAYYMLHGKEPRWGSRKLFCAALIVMIIAVQWGVEPDSALWLSIATNVLIATVISWILFGFRIRVPVGKRLADCSYSLYATHFPVLLLTQSLLVASGSRSVTAACAVAFVSFIFAGLVALVGGRIEATKPQLQGWLLACSSRLCQAWAGNKRNAP